MEFTSFAALAASTSIALAHHGRSQYSSTPQRLTGVIRVNARGVPQDALKVGASATIEGYAHRTNENELRAEWISLGDSPRQLR